MFYVDVQNGIGVMLCTDGWRHKHAAAGQPLLNLVLLKPSGGAIFQGVYSLDQGESKTRQFYVDMHNNRQSLTWRTHLADMDSRRAFWSVTAAEQVLLTPPPLIVPAIVDLQFPILAKAAVRLLSVHVSTAAAERNWSVWTSIYRNALRNSLSVEQAEKLVYVKANAKYETDTLATPKDILINILE
ncbi:hypothetical protein QJQ45_027295 [Haematococcus lacustris]|nr:hypothetical protein QJQ45_027295 [Haematococcus lacustris]